MNELFSLFQKVLLAHIGTKTVYSTFHSKSQGWYELLFDIFHEISEKRQDLKIDPCMDDDVVIQETFDNLTKTRDILEAMVKEKNSVGMDNLLRSLLDRLEFAIGDASAFIEEEADEEEDDTQWKSDAIPEMKPKNKPLIPKK